MVLFFFFHAEMVFGWVFSFTIVGVVPWAKKTAKSRALSVTSSRYESVRSKDQPAKGLAHISMLPSKQARSLEEGLSSPDKCSDDLCLYGNALRCTCPVNSTHEFHSESHGPFS